MKKLLTLVLWLGLLVWTTYAIISPNIDWFATATSINPATYNLMVQSWTTQNKISAEDFIDSVSWSIQSLKSWNLVTINGSNEIDLWGVATNDVTMEWDNNSYMLEIYDFDEFNIFDMNTINITSNWNLTLSNWPNSFYISPSWQRRVTEQWQTTEFSSDTPWFTYDMTLIDVWTYSWHFEDYYVHTEDWSTIHASDVIEFIAPNNEYVIFWGSSLDWSSDFSWDYTDLSFVQKWYVDWEIATAGWAFLPLAWNTEATRITNDVWIDSEKSLSWSNYWTPWLPIMQLYWYNGWNELYMQVYSWATQGRFGIENYSPTLFYDDWIMAISQKYIMAGRWIEEDTDYSSTYTGLSLVNKDYVDWEIAGLSTNNLYTADWTLTWDRTLYWDNSYGLRMTDLTGLELNANRIQLTSTDNRMTLDSAISFEIDPSWNWLEFTTSNPSFRYDVDFIAVEDFAMSNAQSISLSTLNSASIDMSEATNRVDIEADTGIYLDSPVVRLSQQTGYSCLGTNVSWDIIDNWASFVAWTSVDTGFNNTGSDIIIPSEKTVRSTFSWLTANYIPYWNGTKLANTPFVFMSGAWTMLDTFITNGLYWTFGNFSHVAYFTWLDNGIALSTTKYNSGWALWTISSTNARWQIIRRLTGVPDNYTALAIWWVGSETNLNNNSWVVFRSDWLGNTFIGGTSFLSGNTTIGSNLSVTWTTLLSWDMVCNSTITTTQYILKPASWFTNTGIITMSGDEVSIQINSWGVIREIVSRAW